VFPDPFSGKPVRVGEAERLIRHHRLSTGDEPGVVDLMLALVEAGTEQAVDLGYANAAYFATLERVLDSVVGALRSVPESARPTIVERLRQLVKRAESTGWGYGDAVREITIPAISPRAERRSSRPARRSCSAVDRLTFNHADVEVIRPVRLHRPPERWQGARSGRARRAGFLDLSGKDPGSLHLPHHVHGRRPDRGDRARQALSGVKGAWVR
jgi:hypothetical protein